MKKSFFLGYSKRFLSLLIFTLIMFASSPQLIADSTKKIFDQEEIILSTIEESPTYFRIKRHKVRSELDKNEYYQKTTVERQTTCRGAAINRPRGKADVIGWTTADEEPIAPYFRNLFVTGTLFYHRIDLAGLIYEFQYLGIVGLDGEFTSASKDPWDKKRSNNTVKIKLKIIDEDWDTFFERNRVQTFAC